jgi:hypothetical protein
MHVEIRASIVDGEYDLVLQRPWHQPWVLSSLSEHDLRDLVSELERRRAMGKCCPAVSGEHTCSMPPGHGPDPGHICRACTEIWPVEPGDERG